MQLKTQTNMNFFRSKLKNTSPVLFFITPLFLATISCSSSKNSIPEGAVLEIATEGYDFTEGPASDKEGNIYFTDQPNNTIIKYDVNGNTSVFMKEAGRANGLYIDHQGNLLACADEHNQLWKINMTTKEVTVLLTDFKDKKFNGPNDLWVAPDGGIYFTDPFYKRDYWNHDTPELEHKNVYYLAPGKKEAVVIADNLVQPNGIIGSKDGKTLFVADIGDQKTYKYVINADGSLTNRTLFTNLGSDGMTLDKNGNLYITGKGVSIFDTNGKLIKNIPVPQSWTANVTFGGKNQDILFITAMNTLYKIKTNTKGVRF